MAKGGREKNMTEVDRDANVNWAVLFAAWLIAAVAMLGSLFFSDVMGFAPCVLCWYQRIAVYPLVLIFGVGLFSFDAGVVKYSLPLAVAGWLVALYHTLLYWGIIPKSIQPCSEGVPCTEKYIELFGILSIPFMSFLAFTAILILLIILKRRLAS
jgi:disulfide bond formation protein DsbB